jgi:hypothetical protein
MIKGTSTFAAMMLSISALSSAEEQPTQCVQEADRLSGIQARYAKDIQSLNDEGKKIEDDGKGCNHLDLECHSKPVEWKFDRPTVNMKEQDWSFKIAKIYRHRVNFSTDIITFTSEHKTIGSYPKCRHLKCSKADIVVSIPVTHRETKHFSFDLPKVEWGTTHLKLHVPEFRTVREDWKFDWFSCKVVGAGINSECKTLDSRGSELEQKAKAIEAQQQSEAGTAVAELTECYRQDVLTKRQQFLTETDAAIKSLSEQIQQVRTAGGDPKSLKDADGNAVDLEAQLESLRETQASTLKEMDEAIVQLGETGVTALPTAQ